MPSIAAIAILFRLIMLLSFPSATRGFVVNNVCYGSYQINTIVSTPRFRSGASHWKYPFKALSTSVSVEPDDENSDRLPPTVTPILLTVLALIVSEGIALSTLPLHLQSMGATPVQVGLSTSAFSVAQMVMCPLIVSLSSKPSFGRRKTLSVCLAGAALSSGVIAGSSTIPLIIFARFLAGVFAAAIPVAQAGVTDLVSLCVP